jgi:hypothetical protein
MQQSMPNWSAQLNSKTSYAVCSWGCGVAFLTSLAAACTETAAPVAAPPSDAASEAQPTESDAALQDAAPVDAAPPVDASEADVTSPDSSADASVCTGTRVKLQINGKTIAFERAQFGTLMSGGKHIEMHVGGKPACPGQNSPTPDYTLILTEISATQTADQIVRAAFFDFKGDALQGAPFIAFRVSLSAVFSGAGAAETGCVQVKSVTAQPDAGTVMVSGSSTLERCLSLDD